jgi:hypothetical protein
MPNAHGTKKAYELDKCRCDICVPAQRERWADKDARKRQRASEPNPSRPVVGERPALRVVRQAEATPAKPQESAASEPASDAPPVPLRGARSIEMPRLWPIHDTEPEYAEEHREFLAGVILYILKDPAHNASNVTFTKDSPKQEAKDFERLLGVFQRNNPEIMRFHHVIESYRGLPYFGAYYEFQVYGPEYEFPEYEDEDEADESGDATGGPPQSATGTRAAAAALASAPPLSAPVAPRQAVTRAPRAAARVAPRPKPYAGPAQPRNVPMGNAPSVPGGTVRQSDSRMPVNEPESFG